MSKIRNFETEAAFVQAFISKLQTGRTDFGRVQLATEWPYSSGSVDVLARTRNDELVAIEAKLADWRSAFFQAYRSTAYADHAYVLLPEVIAHRAERNRDEFCFRGVGLCAFDGRTIRVIIKSIAQNPLMPWVNERAHAHFDEQYAPRSRNTRLRSDQFVSAARL